MTRRAREVETLLLTMYAAVPLYVTGVVGRLPLLLFHTVMTAIVVRVLMGKGPALVPERALRWLAFVYVPFYVLDATMISRSAIAASTHLVLFIAAYQPIESMGRNNHGQRLLTAALIFVASLATSTHITVIAFVVVFAFLMLRQLMYLSHLETVRSMGELYAEPPTSRAAAFYLAGAAVIGALLFPLLPRVRNPFVQGITGSLSGAATGLSDTIDFSERRVTSQQATVVARVWMDQQTRPFFTPVRLRGPVYDRYRAGEWRQSLQGLREIREDGGRYVIARAGGVEREATVQQKPRRGKLYLPVGTVALSGVSSLFEGPAQESYYTYHDGMVNASVRMAYEAEPLRLRRVGMSGYPVSPEIEGLARAIVRGEQRPDRQAALIENYLSRNFRYIPNPTTRADIVSLDEFLLRSRAGHCEYFAAGMVVLLNALDVPARIAGGFYGGRLNPLTGYYSIRMEDAHAWTEVWDGHRWITFDATPPALRPGTAGENALLEYLAALADSANFFWDRYILTFGLGDQVTLIADALARARELSASIREGAAADLAAMRSREFGVFAAALIAAGLLALRLRRRHDALFRTLAGHLRAHGVEVGPSTTLEEALRLLEARDPQAARRVEPLVALYDEDRFGGRPSRARAAEVRKRLAELRG